jgi:fibronectin type 3 domain-containing protein
MPASTSYLDAGVATGTTYAYSVRSVEDRGGQAVESADSNLATVVDRPATAPAAPQYVIAAPIPRQGDAPPHVELSWQISSEPDLAGYNVYRTETSAERGERQTTALLHTPAFRDMNVAPGRRYFYTVTAVDRSGNESAPSKTAPAAVPVVTP